jgi:hypothetical protein
MIFTHLIMKEVHRDVILLRVAFIYTGCNPDFRIILILKGLV